MSIENLIFRCLERFWASKYNARYGVVTSYDPEKHAAKVKIKPFDVETGWLPIQAHHVGNGWGIVVGLQIGDQVKITHNNGDFEIGEITARVHDDESKPPQVKSGEILIKHEKAGSFFLDKDKNITWSGANGQIIKTDKKGNTSVSLKVSSQKDSDSNSPTYTLSLTDQNNKNHTVTIDKTGIAHKSDMQVSIKVGDQHEIVVDKDNGIAHKSATKIHLHAPQIEHNGNLTVNGTVEASQYIQGSVSYNENE
jgi:phage baseplate assembly protein gpV